MGILIFTLISLIIIIIFSQSIDIRLYEVDAKPTVKVGFTIFAIELSRLDRRQKNKKPLRDRVRGAIFLATFLRELVSRSTVTVRSLNILRDGLFSPSRLIFFAILRPILEGYLERNSFSYTEAVKDGTVDINFSFNLFSVFISFGLALYYNIKTRIKRRLNA